MPPFWQGNAQIQPTTHTPNPKFLVPSSHAEVSHIYTYIYIILHRPQMCILWVLQQTPLFWPGMANPTTFCVCTRFGPILYMWVVWKLGQDTARTQSADTCVCMCVCVYSAGTHAPSHPFLLGPSHWRAATCLSKQPSHQPHAPGFGPPVKSPQVRSLCHTQRLKSKKERKSYGEKSNGGDQTQDKRGRARK